MLKQYVVYCQNSARLKIESYESPINQVILQARIG